MGEGQIITTPQSNKIYTNCWKPNDDSPKALVFIVHGYGEYSEHYEDVIPKLTDCGFVVFAHDNYGHGHSEGDVRKVESIELFSDDTIFYIQESKVLYPHLPIFLIGHSFGGLITLDIVLRKPDLTNGIILIGAALKASPETATPMRIAIGRWVARLCPNVVMARLDSSKVTRNQEHIDKYSGDPLVFTWITAKFGLLMFDAQARLEEQFDKITLPMLITHGTNDQLCDISGSRILMEKVSSPNKTYKEFPDAYHQLHHEPDGVGDEFMKVVCDWINAQLTS